MTGLDTIVEQILQEAQKEAEEIKAQAARNADSIIANAKMTVDKMNEETSEKVAQAEKSGSFRAKSSSELKKRQAILAAKQSIIGNMLDKAYDAMVALPDEEYFQVIVKCLEKSVQPKSGEICFSVKDRKRLTPQIEKQIEPHYIHEFVHSYVVLQPVYCSFLYQKPYLFLHCLYVSLYVS